MKMGSVCGAVTGALMVLGMTGSCALLLLISLVSAITAVVR